MATSREKRIVELELRAIGDADIKRMTADLGKMREAADKSQKSLDDIEKQGRQLGTTLRGLLTGVIAGMVVNGFQSMARAIGNASKELGDLKDKTGGGSKEFEQYSKAAQALNSELEAVGETIGDVVKGITIGMTPALIGLAKTFNDAVPAGKEFVELGRRIGEIVTWAAKQVTYFGSVLDSLLKAFDAFDKGVQTTKKGMWATFTGEREDANSYRQSALSYFESAKSYWNSSGDLAEARANAIQRNTDAAAKITGIGKPAAEKAKKGRAGKTTAANDDDNGFLKELTANLRLYTNAVADAADAQLDQIEALNEMVDGMNKAADPLSNLLQAQLDISRARDTGRLTREAEAEATRAATEQYNNERDALKENSEAYKAHQAELHKQAEQAERLRETWGFVGDAFGEMTHDILTQTESIGRAVRRMVATIISELARLAMQKLATKLLGSLFGNIGGGGNLAPVDYGAISSAAGNIRVPGYASGGVIGGPVAMAGPGGIGIAGEAGPEVIAPLRRDASGNMGVATPQPKVTVNNYAGADVAVAHTDQGLQIDILRRQIADDIRRGGNPVSAALEGTYKVGRYAGAFA